MKLWTKVIITLAGVMFFTFILPILATSGISWLFGIATAILSVAAILLWVSTIGEDNSKKETSASSQSSP